MLYNYFDEVYEAFNDYLDEANPEIIINGISYLPSKVLYETDPVAYEVAYNDYSIDTDDKYAFGE
jgi:hypothetical protein